jgi:hypothetical protein
MKSLLLYAFLLSGVGAVRSGSEWVLKKDKGWIKVYSRHSDISKFNDIRIETDLPGTILQLTSILLDIEKYPEWGYSLKSCEVVKKVSPHEIIYYSEVWVPWPANNRDFYADLRLMVDTVGGNLHVISIGLKDYPVRKNISRIPMSRGVWNVSTLPGGRIHLSYVLQVDPGGSLPAWLLNLFATRGPLETFENLRKKMESLNR